MALSDRCCWPGCRAKRDCLYVDKPLCDKHTDLVQSEDPGVSARSRRKIGLPPVPTFAGRPPTADEFYNVLCCFPGCEYTASIFEKTADGERPFCGEHFSRRNEIKVTGPIQREKLDRKKPEPEEEEFDLDAFESRLEGGTYDWGDGE